VIENLIRRYQPVSILASFWLYACLGAVYGLACTFVLPLRRATFFDPFPTGALALMVAAVAGGLAPILPGIFAAVAGRLALACLCVCVPIYFGEVVLKSRD
jgi:hypothetical protein